jgi:hypothetical protein
MYRNFTYRVNICLHGYRNSHFVVVIDGQVMEL